MDSIESERFCLKLAMKSHLAESSLDRHFVVHAVFTVMSTRRAQRFHVMQFFHFFLNLLSRMVEHKLSVIRITSRLLGLVMLNSIVIAHRFFLENFE